MVLLSLADSQARRTTATWEGPFARPATTVTPTRVCDGFDGEVRLLQQYPCRVEVLAEEPLSRAEVLRFHRIQTEA